MLQRNLLYTAVTRAKRIVVLVGSKRALAKAVRTEGAGRRYTALAERLRRGRTQVGLLHVVARNPDLRRDRRTERRVAEHRQDYASEPT